MMKVIIKVIGSRAGPKNFINFCPSSNKFWFRSGFISECSFISELPNSFSCHERGCWILEHSIFNRPFSSRRSEVNRKHNQDWFDEEWINLGWIFRFKKFFFYGSWRCKRCRRNIRWQHWFKKNLILKGSLSLNIIISPFYGWFSIEKSDEIFDQTNGS